MYHSWLGPMAVRILVASNTVASVWSANTTVRITVPTANSGATNGQVPSTARRAPEFKQRPPTRDKRCDGDEAGRLDSESEGGGQDGQRRGASLPEVMARSIST